MQFVLSGTFNRCKNLGDMFLFLVMSETDKDRFQITFYLTSFLRREKPKDLTDIIFIRGEKF